MNVDVHPQRIVSLCSGVGWLDEGLRLGLEYFGLDSRVVAYVERESYAASVLLARMVDESLEPAPISDSISDLDEGWRGCVDWLVAGFPCQPWSSAGKQQGTDDSRWLWPEIADCIRRVGPAGVFLENVPGLICGHGLEHVLHDLAQIGFDAEWGCVTAESVGAAHRRERVFILGGSHRRTAVGRRGAEVGDTGGERGSAGHVAVQRSGTQPAAGLPDDTGEGRCRLGDSSSSRLSNAEQRGESIATGGQRDARAAVGEPGGTPIFAPGPGTDWRGISQWLWPATEPGFRVLADGEPLVVDASRADQLRCAGNGCVALQAAVAFVELVRRINN